MVADVRVVVTDGAAPDDVLPGQRVIRVEEGIVRSAVQPGDVSDGEGGVVEDRLAAADRLLSREQEPVEQAGRLPGREEREVGIRESWLQRVVDADGES